MLRTYSRQKGGIYYKRAKLLKRPVQKDQEVTLLFDVGEPDTIECVVTGNQLTLSTVLHFTPGKNYAIDGYAIDGKIRARSIQPS